LLSPIKDDTGKLENTEESSFHYKKK
jgi:hypothetical protein